MRVGIGYDVHQTAKDRPLIIGGVELDYSPGLAGHSDADVLVHAVMDALLGAAGLGDIGGLFPETAEFAGADSLVLLKRVGTLLHENGYTIVNVDSTVIAQAPKIAPYKREMAANIARALGIQPSQVNVKATTEEGLGFTGRGEGIAAQAAVLIIEN